MAKKLFQDGKRYTMREVQTILAENGRKCVDLWPNVWGWDLYFTTEFNMSVPTPGGIATRRRVFVDRNRVRRL